MPGGGVANPDEIAGLVVFLTSDLFVYIVVEGLNMSAESHFYSEEKP